MSEKYKTYDPEKPYFVTLTIVGWINVFTNKKYKFWQDGFHPEIIYNPNFFYEKLQYIHKNPVKEMIVENEEDYLFSSARNYAGLSSVLDVITESGQLITY